MSKRAVLWVLGGLLGIVLTAGITWATSKLTSQHIGLSSQPLSSMRSLAPRTLPPAETKTTTTMTRTTTSAATTPRVPFTATTTTSHTYSTQTTTSSEDGGGSSRRGQRSGHEPDD